MNIYTYGEDARLSVCRHMIEEASPEEKKPLSAFFDIYLLPIPSYKYTGSPKDFASGSLVVGYEIPKSISEYENADYVTLDLALDETFLEENARLTALGTVGYLLTEDQRAIPELSFGILGYGRIGKRLARYLLFLGARVRIYTSREDAMLSLASLGVETALVRWGEEGVDEMQFSDLDYLINTSPSPLLKAAPSCRVLDLASGAPIPISIPHTRLPSLPAKMYHVSAGRACYRAILRAFYGGTLL